MGEYRYRFNILQTSKTSKFPSAPLMSRVLEGVGCGAIRGVQVEQIPGGWEADVLATLPWSEADIREAARKLQPALQGLGFSLVQSPPPPLNPKPSLEPPVTYKFEVEIRDLGESHSQSEWRLLQGFPQVLSTFEDFYGALWGGVCQIELSALHPRHISRDPATGAISSSNPHAFLSVSAWRPLEGEELALFGATVLSWLGRGFNLIQRGKPPGPGGVSLTPETLKKGEDPEGGLWDLLSTGG